MQWIPAIDLKDGQVVRLKQGRMDAATCYSSDPVAMAKTWLDHGATRLHLVDLNGAFAGAPVNVPIIEKIAALDATLKIQVGGGIRSAETIRHYVSAGVAYCILGTVAVKDRPLTEALCAQFKGQIILGIDARDGDVATEGWAEGSNLTAAEVAHHYQALAPVAIIYTDINRDGMLSGPNLEASRRLAQTTRTPVIVSGGVSSLEDLKQIKALHDAPGTETIIGAILGKALYEGRFTLKAALEI